MKTVLYIHGRGGNKAEAEHYKKVFPGFDVIGIEYKSDTPWEVGEEIKGAIEDLNVNRLILIANSIGAFFAMNANIEKYVTHAFFISPVVDMEKLIVNMMYGFGISEEELQKKDVIHTNSGEDLSWEYLCYVRSHPVCWNVPTDILYGSADQLISIDTIADFTNSHNASLTVMENGEHWFHTEEQMHFLDEWMEEKVLKAAFKYI